MERSPFELTGRVAIVTGAGRGIGKGVALALARAGADVAVVSRTATELQRTAEAIGALGRRCCVVPADVTSTANVRALVQQTVDHFGQIDILVNNAGSFQHWSAPEEIDDAEWERVQNVNLRSVFVCAREVGRLMIPRREGAIVNVSSIAGPVGVPRMAAYAAAKAGIIGLTRSLAIDWAEHNIRVNAVAPAFINSEATREDVRQHLELIEVVRTKTPLARFGDIEEVAATVQFLASPGAGYITGQTIFVDGGWTVW